MKKIFLLSLIGLILAACGAMTTTALFKPGASAAQKQRDLDQCKITSLRVIPQAFTTMTNGGFYEPGSIDCYSGRHGHTVCQQFGDLYIPPSFYTIDQNTDLRWRFVQGCLAKKGYRIVGNLRPCSSEQERTRAMNARNISELTCNPDSKLDY